jgi:hypothetical protein
MATSPLFGWEEPDDVDLVKDGAAAIRTLGNAIDTSMGDLLGGTTGQVLSKNSNTNMDFTWVTSDDANAIQNTIVDAKGDLISATGSDVPARLAVGTNGTILTADSTASTGIAWATPAMTLVNTTTFSAVSAQTIDSLFSSTYNNYKIVVNITGCSGADVDLYAQFRSGGSNVTTNNNTQTLVQHSTTITGAQRSDLIVLGQISTTYPTFANQTVDVCNPFLSATTTISANGGYVTNAGVPFQFRSWGYNFSTTSMTGINIYPSSGTISGTIRIYGLRNS